MAWFPVVVEEAVADATRSWIEQRDRDRDRAAILEMNLIKTYQFASSRA